MHVARPGPLLFGLVLGVYLLTAAGHLQSSDVGGELQVAQSMFGASGGPLFQIHDAYGWHFDQHGLGESLLLVPAVLAGLAVPSRAHAVTVLAGSFLNPVCAAVTVLVFFDLLRLLGVAMRRAVGLSLVLAFATALFAYAHDSYDVTPTGLFLLLALWACVRGRDGDARWWLLAGAAAGFAAVVRQSALVCAPAFAYLLLVSVERRRRPVALLASGAGGLAFLVVIGLYNAWRFGSPLQSGFDVVPDAPADFHLSYLPGGLAAILFSPGGSVLLYSPPLVAGLAGLRRAFAQWPAVTVAALWMAGATTVFSALYYEPTGGAWGCRYLVPVTAPLLLPAAALPNLRHAWISVLTGFGVLVQLLGVVIDYELQRQLALDAGHGGYIRWDFVHTPLLQHARAIVDVALGRAEYPASRLAGDAASGRPPVTTWDFWWVYAWITGTARLGAAGAGAVLAGVAATCAVRLREAAASES